MKRLNEIKSSLKYYLQNIHLATVERYRDWRYEKTRSYIDSDGTFIHKQRQTYRPPCNDSYGTMDEIWSRELQDWDT